MCFAVGWVSCTFTFAMVCHDWFFVTGAWYMRRQGSEAGHVQLQEAQISRPDAEQCTDVVASHRSGGGILEARVQESRAGGMQV
jgi:hypothetical protein